ncbi:preprotein translocase subunit SecA [Vibrio maerlii]|uniref:preprotein translocase subunit SecA n=1 Tax=Vibrio maerlii TaxID=2231648 RepID=UPI000E3E4723|nr:preprotein translocase subunit SecA [Vibrio maerlii]
MYSRPSRLPNSELERPQKSIAKSERMVRWWNTLTSYTSRPIRSSVWFYRPLLWRTKRLESELEALSEQELDTRIEVNKRQLHRDGLTTKLLIECFALIREVSGRELGMWHFDSQILGGLAILHGNIGQMQTGEGKTLTATLPVAAAAMAGVPTHVVTVNDYLTERDAELMNPVYTRLGLTVGVVIQGQELAERQDNYRCDIVYCTNNELAFDYLKDRIELASTDSAIQLHAQRAFGSHTDSGINKLMLRGLHFAVVDEADGVFMDEASTPLIISGEETPQEGQELMYQQAYSLVEQLVENEDFRVIKQPRFIELTVVGKQNIEKMTEGLGALWKGQVRRLELARQALTAQYLFERDKHYLVDDGKVIIIDEHTGRRMPDRTWERGLHQLIEIKEHCELSNPRSTLASISFQNFFRYYHHLSGMTGTADEVKSEFWRIYGLPVVDIPTHKPSKRKQLGTTVHRTDQDKWQSVVDRVVDFQSQSERAILIGTQSLRSSEQLSSLLEFRGIPHQVLNAKQDQEEAEIVKAAGHANRVTIATSMAGRGTDIKLDDEVEAEGGLHVIITGLHDSSRVDRQLEGRCARQGDRGSVEFQLSLEDEVINHKWAKILLTIYQFPLSKRLKNKLLLRGIRRCQTRIEQQQERMRKELLVRDEQQQEVLSFSERKV